MKNKKILSLLSACLVMGLVACSGPATSKDSSSSSKGGDSQLPSTPVSASSSKTSSAPAPSTSQGPQKDKTGHIWGADADVAGDAEQGLAAYKRAVCTEDDKAVKYTVNQSVVTLASGSSRKSGTPEG